MTAQDHATAGLSRQRINEIATRVLADLTQRDEDSLDQGVRLFLDLGLTSLNALELIMLLTDELGVRLKTDALDWRHLETLGSLTHYVAEQTGI